MMFWRTYIFLYQSAKTDATPSYTIIIDTFEQQLHKAYITVIHTHQLREDVRRMLESLGFPEKRASLAGQLSGGQKRRLCVGISMIGGNSVVYLDEVSDSNLLHLLFRIVNLLVTRC